MQHPGTLVLLVLLGFGWGAHVVLAKALGAENARAAVAYLAVYMSCTSLGLLVACALRSRLFRPSPAEIGYFAIVGFGVVGPILAELLIAPRIDAALFALIASLTPVATVSIAILAGMARMTRRLGLALICGMVAALLVLGPDVGLVGAGHGFWVAMAFSVPVLYAATDVFIQARWPAGRDLYQVTAGEAVVALVGTLALAAAFGLGPRDITAAAAAGGWALAAMVAASFTTIWLFYYLVRLRGAVFVSFAGFVSLATGVGAGVLFFGERPGLALAGAALLTIAALWLLQAESRGEAQPSRP